MPSCPSCLFLTDDFTSLPGGTRRRSCRRRPCGRPFERHAGRRARHRGAGQAARRRRDPRRVRAALRAVRHAGHLQRLAGQRLARRQGRRLVVVAHPEPAIRFPTVSELYQGSVDPATAFRGTTIPTCAPNAPGPPNSARSRACRRRSGVSRCSTRRHATRCSRSSTQPPAPSPYPQRTAIAELKFDL